MKDDDENKEQNEKKDNEDKEDKEEGKVKKAKLINASCGILLGVTVEKGGEVR